jgi:hypothetical protein
VNGIFGIITYFICNNIIHLSINNYFSFLVKTVLISIVVAILMLIFNLIVYKKEFLLLKEKFIVLFKKKQS